MLKWVDAPNSAASTSAAAEFEVAFYEGQSSFFDVFYGITSDNGSDETSGVQASGTGPATTFSCGVATLIPGLKVRYNLVPCPSPTPTATATPTGRPKPQRSFSRKSDGLISSFDQIKKRIQEDPHDIHKVPV